MADGDDPTRPTLSLIQVGGTAARTRIREYRQNAGDRDRSLSGLLKWAAEHGVGVPDYAKVEVDEDFQPTRNGFPVEAKYCEFKDATNDELIYWEKRSERHRSMIALEQGVIIINLAPDITRNDERFLHVLAHEVFELVSLKKVFDECGGSVPAERLYALLEPLNDVMNLHWHAWEKADSLIEQLRGNGQ